MDVMHRYMKKIFLIFTILHALLSRNVWSKADPTKQLYSHTHFLQQYNTSLHTCMYSTIGKGSWYYITWNVTANRIYTHTYNVQSYVLFEILKEVSLLNRRTLVAEFVFKWIWINWNGFCLVLKNNTSADMYVIYLLTVYGGISMHIYIVCSICSAHCTAYGIFAMRGVYW